MNDLNNSNGGLVRVYRKYDLQKLIHSIERRVHLWKRQIKN